MNNTWMDNTWMSGEELYNAQIVGGLNRLPVNRIKDGVVSTLVEELDVDTMNILDNLVFRLLVSGSIIIVDGLILHGEIYFVDKGSITTAFQFIKTKERKYIRKWEQNPISTVIITYEASGVSKDVFENEEKLYKFLENKKVLDTTTISSEGVIIVSNGQGILLPARSTIERIEDLMGTLEETTGEEALTWFITNWVGDINKLMAKSRDGGRFAALPDGATLQNASDASFSDRVFKELDMLKPMYLEATYSYVVYPGESGISRYLGMMGYINKVKQTQKLSSYIFEQQGISISFDNTIWVNILEV